MLATDSEEYKRKVNLLRPSDEYSVQWLAWFRAAAAVFFVIYAAIVMIGQTEEFWKYLTNLTYITNMFAFTLLTYLHYVNGDFTRSTYQAPSHSDLNASPFTYAKIGTYLYELSQNMNLLVAIAFWLVELPALCMTGRILVIGR